MEFTNDATLVFYKNAIGATQDEFEQLIKRMPPRSERETIRVYMYTGPAPRTQKLFGEVDYNYSTLKLKADPDIDPLVQRCIDFARGKYPEYEFNGALVNLYEDGKDSVGWHSDNEDSMVPGCPIVSISFGWTRLFKVRTVPKYWGNEKKNWDFLLENGDIIVMQGKDFQRILQHAVPKVLRKIKQGEDTRRINITVRPFLKKM
jgi:alkylated DNA repair dioxygenase AlkB